MTGTGLTTDEVASQAGVTNADVDGWERLGLITRDGAGTFALDVLERARFLRFAIERGITAEAIAHAGAASQDDILGRYVALLGTTRGAGCSVDEAATRLRVDPRFVRRLRVAAGLSDRDEILDDDLAMIRGAAAAVEMGLPEDAVLQLARVYTDALGRVADAEVRLFHFYVHEPLRAQGIDGRQLEDAVAASREPLMALSGPAVLYAHRNAFERALREDLVAHLRDDVEPGAAVGELPVVVVFIDVTGFTPLTETAGDLAATEMLDRFSHLVRDATARHAGRVVKQIGDEFMLVFPSPASGVRCSLEVLGAAADAGLPALRIGAHQGAALYREADFFGATVNIAARVAGQAEGGELLATGAVATADIGDVAWEEAGERILKGVARPVPLYRARATTGP